MVITVLVIPYFIFKKRKFDFSGLTVLCCYILVLYVSFAQFYRHAYDLEFVRIGHLTSTEVNLHFRVLEKSELHCSELDGTTIKQVLVPLKDNDFILFKTLVVGKNKLYSCKVTRNGMILMKFHFKTLSDVPGTTRIAFGSCTKFNFPFMNTEISGFKTILQQQPDFFIMLGDFIYSDSPMIGGSDYESFAKLYRQTIELPETKTIFSTIPSYFIADDHEVRNDYGGMADPYNEAMKAFYNYASGSNPSNATYFNFTIHNSGFFMFDTRSFRTETTIIGLEQLEIFKNWATYAKEKYQFIFVCSSVPLTSNFYLNSRDTWAYYQNDKKQVLDALHPRQSIFLTGDRHEFGAVQNDFNLEFSVSPIHQFYLPFNKFYPYDPILSYTPYGNNKAGFLDIDPNANSVRFYVLINNKLYYNITIQGDLQ